MRRLLVGEAHLAGLGLAFGLALKQKADAGGEAGDLAVLAGDGIRQILDRAGQMGDLFLKVGAAGHGGP